MITQFAQMTTLWSPEDPREREREGVYGPHEFTVQERGCVISGYCKASGVISLKKTQHRFYGDDRFFHDIRKMCRKNPVFIYRELNLSFSSFSVTEYNSNTLT